MRKDCQTCSVSKKVQAWPIWHHFQDFFGLNLLTLRLQNCNKLWCYIFFAYSKSLTNRKKSGSYELSSFKKEIYREAKMLQNSIYKMVPQINNQYLLTPF